MMLYSLLMLAPAVVIGGLECLESRTIRNKSDLAKIQRCNSFVGSLTIDATEPLDIVLDLQSHVGDFNIIGDNIMNIQLNNLKSITGALFIKASNVETIQLNAFKSNAGSIEIFDSKKLKRVSFNNLRSVVGNLKFKNLESVESIEIPNFTALCGEFELTGVDKLTTFSLPNMEAYEVKISIDSKSLSELNLGKMVEKPGSSINFKNKATFKMNTQIEKDCKSGSIGNHNINRILDDASSKSESTGSSNINQIKNDASSGSLKYSAQPTYIVFFTSVILMIYSATQ